MNTIIISALIGSALTVIVHFLLKKRGQLGYTATHNRVGLSADDDTFGSVRVTHQGTEVSNLYASTVTLTNHSLTDFENVKVRVFTNNTHLLNERTEIVGTTEHPLWEEEFRKTLQPDAEGKYSDIQLSNYRKNRVYIIPTMNRGQIISFTYLNTAHDINEIPCIWLDINHKGAKLKFNVIRKEFYGVSQPAAALTGLFFGLLVLSLTLSHFKIDLLVPILSFLGGAMLIIPGALLVKLALWVKGLLTN